MTDLTRLGIRIEAQGDRLRYAPRSVVTPDLVDRMKAYKDELLEMLSSEPVTPEERRRASAALVERLNAAYRDGPIDWPRLDVLDERIEAAATKADLTAAIAEYVLAAQTAILDHAPSIQ